MAELGPFEQRPAIAVGVSGGADSMALALLLRNWVSERNGRLLALVVDHRLRQGSAAEAGLAAERLVGLGIDAKVLTRVGPAPTAAMQAEARRARYALLEAAAADAGMLHLAVAHHRQDQLETVAFRRASGSGWRGLAGMAPVRELDRLRLIRPLLAMAPGELRRLLEGCGIAWIEDPSNVDPRFWRSRFRARCSPEAIDDSANAAAAQRSAVDRECAAFLAAHGLPHPLGFVTVALAPLRALDTIVRRQVLGRLITTTGGNVYPPGQAQLAGLDDWLMTGSGRRRTLGGVLIERLADGMRCMREPRAVARSMPLPPAGLLWDGRFRITARACLSPGLIVRAGGPGWRRRLDRSGRNTEHRVLPSIVPGAVPGTVLATLPLVLAGDTPIRLGPWPLQPAGVALGVAFRPLVRHTDVPTGHSVSGLVASRAG